MRYSDLNETTNLGEDFAYLLKQDCQPFMNSKLYLKLFRGIDGMSGGEFQAINGYKLNTQMNRQPKDSSQEVTDVLNQLYHTTGSPITRNNSVFCASIEKAVGYGVPYLVFPIGDFDVLWHNDIRDAYIEFQMGSMAKYLYTIKPENEEKFRKRLEKEEEQRYFNRTRANKTPQGLAQFKQSSEFKKNMTRRLGAEYATYARHGLGFLDYDKAEEKYLGGFKTNPNDDWNPTVEIMVKCGSYYIITYNSFVHNVKEHL